MPLVVVVLCRAALCTCSGKVKASECLYVAKAMKSFNFATASAWYLSPLSLSFFLMAKSKLSIDVKNSFFKDVAAFLSEEVAIKVFMSTDMYPSCLLSSCFASYLGGLGKRGEGANQGERGSANGREV